MPFYKISEIEAKRSKVGNASRRRLSIGQHKFVKNASAAQTNVRFNSLKKDFDEFYIIQRPGREQLPA
jgi:hypothetical protein